jgi:hypothetical protein
LKSQIGQCLSCVTRMGAKFELTAKELIEKREEILYVS